VDGQPAKRDDQRVTTAKYRVRLADLERSVHVDPEDLVEVHDVTPPQDPGAYEQSSHLPGNVRPFAV
jgi:hypothetical protein